jgi:hypothetical protein
MIDDACSRREFLKKFALLSGGTLMLSATTIACSSELPRTALPSLIGIYFYDGDMNKVELRGNQTVPVHTQFAFVFSTDMNTDLHLTSYRTRITFVDSNSNPIGFTDGWVNARTLNLTPSADLSFNTDYILTVYKAEDSIGNPLNDYADASAAFRTASI